MGTTERLSAQLAEQGAKKTPAAQKGAQEMLVKWKAQHAEKLYSLAKDREQAERIFTICMDTISKNPMLIKCTFDSLAATILKSIQFNLWVTLGECGFVPLKNGKASADQGRDVYECNFWVMYQGLVKLIMNAGNKAVIARTVRVGDHFEYREGFQPPLFVPAVVLGKKRGGRLFTYCAICNQQGLWQVEVMSPDQIATIRSRSRGAAKNDSPWNSKYEDDVDQMWQKTVLKRGAKWVSKSADLQLALKADNEVDSDPNLILSAAEDIEADKIPFTVASDEDSQEEAPQQKGLPQETGIPLEEIGNPWEVKEPIVVGKSQK